ncbi:hypothetical protein PVAND_008369 [Polypedilum vanderplanki]|uniref:Transmembrane protein n=1 Tax=Polypedilum vanderplanki TaxID=319348 RepID=A0A9J6C9E7_POLVA|nr:hypothetical protein PVAND_008369 [Polypedilum vanderplanki]
MARIKTFFGCSDLKTGALNIGYISLFANLLYLLLDIELILLFCVPQSQEKLALFGSYINETNTHSPAFPIILLATVASIYGVLASMLLLCGSLTANKKRVLWWLIYQPIAILSIIALTAYTIYLRCTSGKPFYHCPYLEWMYLFFLIALVIYIALHVYFFIVIIEFYLELKSQEPAPVVEDVEAKVGKEEELQLLESPKIENADETDKVIEEEKLTEEEKAGEEKADEPKKEKKSKCGKLNCTKDIFKCPSIGNCIGPDHFE